MPVLDPAAVQDATAVLIGRVGDLIVGTAFLRALRKGCPEARIKLIVSSLGLDAAALIPCVDRFDAVRRVHWVGPNLMTASGLFFNPCDLAVDLNPSFSRTSAVVMTLLRGAPKRLGFKKGRWDRVFTDQVDAPGEAEHMLDRYARLAAALGLPYEPRPELALAAEHEEQADRLLAPLSLPRDKRWILLHAGNFKKYDNRWPEDKFAALTDRLLEDPGLQPVYLAGPGELEPTRAIVASLKKSVPVVPPAPVGVVGALMKRMALCVMSITGTTHLAGAVGAPTLGLYAGYTHAVWRLRGPRAFEVVSRDWRSCRGISVEAALDGVRRALSTLSTGTKTP